MDIKPFQGWRYAAADGNVGDRIAPPYDILSQADKAALLARDERNIVAVDLPHCPPAEVGPDSAYRAAAETLAAWQVDGTMVREGRPALYAYRQDFTWAGRSYQRRAIVAAVRLAAFGEGVWPHEKTFAGPKADRLKLNRATGMQLSPIFGFYEDAPAAAEALFAAVANRPPDLHGELGGVRQRLWAVCDETPVARVREELGGKDLFIADGHHRYTTALNYREELGDLPADHPANFAMFVLAAMDDPGLIILPTHRLIRGLRDFDPRRLAVQARGVLDFAPVELSPEDVADADRFLSPHGPQAMAMAVGPAAWVVTLRDVAVMSQVAPEALPAVRELGVSILHRLVIDRYLADCKTNEMMIDYMADGPAALAAVRAGRADAAFFLPATPLETVAAVARAGGVMPHKSTYFYPKPATGMVLYPLAP